MRREYDLNDILTRLNAIQKCRKDALIATDIIVGYLGETDETFQETLTTLKKSVISRFHVFRFSNRAHTAAFYLKSQYKEPTPLEKKDRSQKLIELSSEKMKSFSEGLIGISVSALAIQSTQKNVKLLLHNHIEGFIQGKKALPGQIMRVTIIAAKDGIVVCKES